MTHITSANTIKLTRGDTLDVNVVIEKEDGTAYTPASGDVVRFALKSAYSDTSCLIRKTLDNSTLKLRLESSETKTLTARTKPYVYDIELTKADGTVDTFIANGEFVVTEEVY